MIKPLLAALLLLMLAAPLFAEPIPDGKVRRFTHQGGQFFIDGTPIRLRCGEIDPGRIPPEFWDDRIKKARAMGLNAVSPYLFWNQIEPKEGQFVFQGNTDVRRFVRLCQDDGLWVILRPGPYICGEWEFGGFPAWLLKHSGIGLRKDEPRFMEFSKEYVQKIHDQVGDLQVTHGGPILMVQFENEDHKIDRYMRDVHDIFVQAGFDTLLMTCDPGGPVWNQISGGIPGVLRGYNGFSAATESRYQQSTRINAAEGFPVLSPEVYTGWFNTFGPPRPRQNPPFVPIAKQLHDTQWLLDHKNLSWSYYVFDGGTNFGFMAGANHGAPMQTSYDYDAPVNELGQVTPKYKALRDLMSKDLGVDLPPIPADPHVIEIPAFSLSEQAALLDRLPAAPIESDNVVTMEKLDQNYGFVDYRKAFDAGVKGTLDLTGAVDYSIVMIDGRVVGEAFSGYGPGSFKIDVDQSGPFTLDILVHNLGRDSLLPERSTLQTKGLNRNPTLDGRDLTGWRIYSMPLDDPDQLPAPHTANSALPTGPAFYSGTFNLGDLGETYLDMSDWHMGVVWVNGHNLGRYWDVGSGRALYLPSPWEKQGENEIVVLELGTPPDAAQIKGVTKMVTIAATHFKPFWTK